MSAAEAALIGAVVAAVLTLVGAFGVEILRDHLHTRRENDQALREACERLIAAVQLIGYNIWLVRVRQVRFQSMKGAVAFVAGASKPPDTLEVGQLVAPDLRAMQSAFATIRSLADGPVIKQATRVVDASRNLTELATRPPTRDERRKPDDLTPELESAIRQLRKETRQLIRVLREHLCVREVGLDVLLLTETASSASRRDEASPAVVLETESRRQ